MKRSSYAWAALAVFLVEVAIALWGRGSLRGFAGDALVVVLMYCLIRALFMPPAATTALGVLLFAFCIEGLQAVDYAHWLGLDRYRWASIVLGRTFSWMDFVAYAVGYTLIELGERASGTGR